MPTLKRNSVTTTRRSAVMDDVNQVERSESDTSSSNKIVFQHENGNINLDDLLSRNSVKDLTLESDEILVIGYTEGNNSLDEITKTAKDKQPEHEDNANKPDLINVNNAIAHNDNLYVSVNDSTDQTSNKGASNQSCSLTDGNEMGEKSLNEPNVTVEVDTGSSKSDGMRCLNINGGCSKQVNNESWGVVDEEPIHMTLEDVQLSLYDWEFPVTESNDNQVPNKIRGFSAGKFAEDKIYQENEELELRGDAHPVDNNKIIESSALYHHRLPRRVYSHRQNSPTERSPNSRSLKHTLCHWLGLGKCANAEVDGASSHSFSSGLPHASSVKRSLEFSDDSREPSSSIVNRALPPLPNEKSDDELENKSTPTLPSAEDETKSPNDLESLEASERIVPDFAVSICKVKDCGWYWGPISGEMAEKILSSEPDGSFVVRDSSDERYIFSLTFKLNGFVRHVRIEHDHGNFSFGSFTKFKSHTIVEFIENAVRHSRSGRYLFFLHRRPALGPMRVQLLFPVSRFKRVQSLQHMCRFVILKAVRRDLIAMLPLPLKLKNYLDTQQYYTEQMQDMQSPAAAVNFDQFGSLESIS